MVNSENEPIEPFYSGTVNRFGSTEHCFQPSYLLS